MKKFDAEMAKDYARRQEEYNKQMRERPIAFTIEQIVTSFHIAKHKGFLCCWCAPILALLCICILVISTTVWAF